MWKYMIVCPVCNGLGKLKNNKPCDYCSGSGCMEESKEVLKTVAQIKERIEEEKTKGIKKNVVVLTCNGVKQNITKWEYDPFSGGYFIEWEDL